MYIATLSTLFIVSALNTALVNSPLNAAQERTCSVTTQLYDIFWYSLGYTTQTGKTPSFHELIKNGCYEQIEAVILKEKESRAEFEHYNPFFEQKDEQGSTPLLIAAERGDPEIVLLLLQNGASATDVTRNTKLTPLHVAAKHGHFDAACMLLRANANVNAQDAIRNTPAHYAFKHGHAKLGAYFIDCCGAYKNSINREKKTPEQCLPENSSSTGLDTEIKEPN